MKKFKISKPKKLTFDDLKVGMIIDFIKKKDSKDIVTGKISDISDNKVEFTNIDYPNVGKCYYSKYSLDTSFDMIESTRKNI